MADEDNAPAEGQDGQGDGAVAGGAPKKKKMLLIMSSAIAVVGIIVAVGVVFFLGGEHKDEAPVEDSKTANLIIYSVPEFNLSLLSEDPNAQHFIKIKVSIELTKPTDTAEVEKMLPRLQDDWGGFLRQMRMGDLQGSANLQRLKEGLLRRANQSLDPVVVRAVYIRELLIQ